MGWAFSSVISHFYHKKNRRKLGGENVFSSTTFFGGGCTSKVSPCILAIKKKYVKVREAFGLA